MYLGRPQNGIITNACNLKLEHFNIEKIIQKVLNKPIATKNDGMCAGIAEKEYGALKGVENGVFLGVGTGVGCGIFLHGKLEEKLRGVRTYDNRKRW